ncbi:hypothetical protein DVA86_29665 [Streptomyces armeniacus]|uniref:Uncharacterized protein n=1 Tax=Streptomyces armeniacus TaxID=83291 RepID=A0A345XWX4_9ACTN|nr:hypothetical protein [Streptomyces armeniacus]AXK36140.1 hypothetical protein DVA86_29665 [Streptomyces armeniacus]QIQ28625.1 Nbc29 [Streptomyces sp.]
MTDDSAGVLLVRASRALQDCEFRLRCIGGEDGCLEPLAEARRHCDEAERRSAPDDAETAATLAVLRAAAATFALWHCVDAEACCDFDDDDGTLLNGMCEEDAEGVSRPLAEQAVEAARAALHVDPGDALVPLYLGHALTWSGDREGAVHAYEEALRRDPWDSCARAALMHLDALPDGERTLPDGESWDEARFTKPRPELSHGRHGFVLLRLCSWVDNNNPDSGYFLFDSFAAARAFADEALTGDNFDFEDGDDEEEGAFLYVHRPGQPVAEYDLGSRVRIGSDGEPDRIDWPEVPDPVPLESPLPPGRPLRIGGRTCF